jgi:hypothetical protein
LRSVSVLFALLVWSAPGFAVSLPPGWRFPNAGDRTGEWEGTSAPFHIRGDFNSDGVTDEAWILFRKNSATWAVFAFLRTSDGTADPIQLVEEQSAAAQRFVLETIRPSKIVFRTACGKGYFECAKGEPLTLQFHLPSISFCLRQSVCSVFIWQPKTARFQRIRMSD